MISSTPLASITIHNLWIPTLYPKPNSLPWESDSISLLIGTSNTTQLRGIHDLPLLSLKLAFVPIPLYHSGWQHYPLSWLKLKTRNQPWNLHVLHSPISNQSLTFFFLLLLNIFQDHQFLFIFAVIFLDQTSIIYYLVFHIPILTSQIYSKLQAESFLKIIGWSHHSLA